MKNKSRYKKKDLKKRLAAILMIYMEGLNNEKQEKLSKYLENKMGNVVDYYINLLKRKKEKHIVMEQLVKRTFSHLGLPEKDVIENGAATEKSNLTSYEHTV